MSIDAWLAAVLLAATAVAAAVLSRWRLARRLREMSRQFDKLDAVHQNTLRMLRGARRQVTEQQLLVAEYRRRLAGAEQSKRRRAPVVTQALPELAEEVTQPLGQAPEGWADTLPM